MLEKLKNIGIVLLSALGAYGLLYYVDWPFVYKVFLNGVLLSISGILIFICIGTLIVSRWRKR